MNPGFLTLIVAIATLLAVMGGVIRVTDMVSTDNEPSGNWGIFEYREQRRRTMTPHEQRWQSVLVQAMDDDYHWTVLVEMLDLLDADAGGAQPPPSAPESPDLTYLNQRIARLNELSEETRRST